jgi:hypothetical protein
VFETDRSKLRRLLPYALFLILVLVFLWKPIFTGQALLPGDYLAQMKPWSSVLEAPDPAPQWNPLHWDAISQFYPWRVHYAQSIRSGHFPLSNPYQFSGTPFLANGQSACLYPFNFIFIIFNTITAFTIFAALHLFLAQVFMYWLMRELYVEQFGSIVAAIVFTFSAFIVLWLELPTFISVAIWLPLTLLLVHRAVHCKSLFYGLLSGASLAMSFLAGHFQIALYVALAVGLWWIWQIVGSAITQRRFHAVLKSIGAMLGCIIIAGMISAPQILPSQQLAAHSHRVREITESGYQSFVDNALPAYRLVTAFAPRFFGDPSQNSYYLLGRIGENAHIGSAADYMEYGLYAGILPLMLAMIALGSIRKKNVGFFASLTVLALLTALGTPINRLFYFGIPGFSALGGPNRILLLYFFGMAALAGFGADYYLSEGDGRRVKLLREKRLVTRLWLCASYLILIVAFFVSLQIGQSTVANLIHSDSVDVGPPIALVLMMAGWLFLGAYMRAPRDSQDRRFLSSNSVSVIVAVFIIADLFVFGINFNPTCERSKVYPDTPLTDELQRLTQNGERIAPINSQWSLFETPRDAILPPNAAIIYGLYDVQGYDSLFTKNYQTLLAEIEGVDPSPPENGNILFVRKYTPELPSVASYAISEAAIEDENAALINTIDGMHIYKLSGEKIPITRYEPSLFGFGLCMMIIGVGLLLSVGVYHVLVLRKRLQC